MHGQGRKLAAAAAISTAVLMVAAAGAFAHRGHHKLPRPGGSPTAVVPIPAPGKYLGFNDHTFLNKRRYVPPQRVAQLAHAAGANMIRYQIPWKEVEPHRDVWDEIEWEKYRAIEWVFAQAGIRSLVTLGSTPGWARKQGAPATCQGEFGCEYPPAGGAIDQWGEYAAEVSKRLQQPVIETWNEPNLSLFFKPAPKPGLYARMHVAAYNAIKRVRPRTTVLLGGNANAQTTDVAHGRHVRFSQRDFLTLIYPKVKGRFDGISLHPYLDPPYRFNKKSLISHALHDARAVQRRFNDEGNPLWVTETGISTSGPRHSKPKKQAKGLLATYRQLATTADVQAVLFHTLFDQTDFPRESRGFGFGQIRSDFPLRVKPSFCEFNGRSGRPLMGGCRARSDKRTPGARLSRSFRKRCRGWLEPQRQFRSLDGAKRSYRLQSCLVDLHTIEAAKKGNVRRISRRAASAAFNGSGAYRVSRGRKALKLTRKTVRRLARTGYR